MWLAHATGNKQWTWLWCGFRDESYAGLVWVSETAWYTDTESAFIKACSGTVIASDSIVYIDMTIIMVVIIIVIMTMDCKIIKFKFLTWYMWRCIRRFARVWFGSLPRTSVSYLLSFFVLLSFVDVLQLLNHCARGVGTASKVSNCCPTYSWNYTLSRGPPRPAGSPKIMHYNAPQHAMLGF